MRVALEDEAEERRASGQGRSEEAALAGFNKLYCSEVLVSEGERGLVRSISWIMNAADACGQREGWWFEFLAGL